MANQNNPQELKGWDKVVAWYARHSYAVNMVYSLGASVVIVGALFKILHWPGASYVLMVGMFTESFLFMLGIFEKPHAVYNWENVFPQLIGHEEKELLGGNGLPGTEPGKQVDTALPEAYPIPALRSFRFWNLYADIPPLPSQPNDDLSPQHVRFEAGHIPCPILAVHHEE